MRLLETLVKTFQRRGTLKERPSMQDYYLKNFHWNRAATTAEGRFRTNYSAPRGMIKRHHDGTFDVFIYDPPQELWKHPRHICFLGTEKKGEYRVNFAVPKSFLTYSGCVMEVERILVQAHTLER
jgi:hypothetical protein